MPSSPPSGSACALDKIRVVQGDTAAIAFGRGTGGSRSLPVGGASVDAAAQKLIAKGRQIAAHLLEAAEADIDFADGVFRIAGHRPRGRDRGGGARRVQPGATAR